MCDKVVVTTTVHSAVPLSVQNSPHCMVNINDDKCKEFCCENI